MNRQTLPPLRFAGRDGMPSLGDLGGMPSLGAAEGRHGIAQGGFHADPTLRVVRACHTIVNACHPIAARRGFTLIELLVTITIIGILAGMVSGALIVARNSGREAATKTTITKLHSIVMAKYESYLVRRVPVELAGSPTTVSQAAALRLFALRDLMRMEMPERLTDLFYVDNGGNPTGVRGPNPVLTGAPYGLDLRTPAIFMAYCRRIAQASPGWSNSDSRLLAPEECLYMIVTMSCGPEERRQFRQSEVADTNGNGLPEFVDGWGKPIKFLRWAPGFNDSDLQPNVIDQSELDLTSPGSETAAWTTAAVLQRRQNAATTDHDRLDPRLINMANSSDSPYVPCGWRLVPLIYSAGPDGEYGITIDAKDPTGPYYWQEKQIPDSQRARYYGTDYEHGWGMPTRKGGAWVHFDNIHNHRVEAE